MRELLGTGSTLWFSVAGREVWELGRWAGVTPECQPGEVDQEGSEQGAGLGVREWALEEGQQMQSEGRECRPRLAACGCEDGLEPGSSRSLAIQHDRRDPVLTAHRPWGRQTEASRQVHEGGDCRGR